MENLGQTRKIGIKDCACQYNGGRTPHKLIGTSRIKRKNFHQEEIRSLVHGITSTLVHSNASSTWYYRTECIGDQLLPVILESSRKVKCPSRLWLTDDQETRYAHDRWPGNSRWHGETPAGWCGQGIQCVHPRGHPQLARWHLQLTEGHLQYNAIQEFWI